MKFTRPETDVMILKILSPKNLAKILAFICSNYCYKVFAKIWSLHWFLRKTPFFTLSERLFWTQNNLSVNDQTISNFEWSQTLWGYKKVWCFLLSLRNIPICTYVVALWVWNWGILWIEIISYIGPSNTFSNFLRRLGLLFRKSDWLFLLIFLPTGNVHTYVHARVSTNRTKRIRSVFREQYFCGVILKARIFPPPNLAYKQMLSTQID
jgi:hypothetical protein